MESRIRSILIEPSPGDIPMIERLLALPFFELAAVVSSVEGPIAGWCAEHGVNRYIKIEQIPGLLPEQVLVIFDDSNLEEGDLAGALSRGLSVVTRDIIYAISGVPAVPESSDELGKTVLRLYRRQLEDYFPTSRQSSTAVKLASCLTETAAIWSCDGVALLTGPTGSDKLSLLRGFGEMPFDLVVPARGDSPIARCFMRGKNTVYADLSEDRLMPGIKAESAACVAVKAGQTVLGVMVLWSNETDHFSEGDLTMMSLFGNYLALLLEVDELSEKLGENLLMDPLTGLHNRRQFETRLRHEIQRAKRYALQVSLVVFDVDSLEEYNKSCGHMLGNLALSDIASILKNGTREVDFTARTGEDEFAALLPETGRLGAIRLAERLRSEIASYPFPVPEDDGSVSITVSAGIASYPSGASDEHELYQNAYRALEETKMNGPNSIKLWEEQ